MPKSIRCSVILVENVWTIEGMINVCLFIWNIPALLCQSRQLWYLITACPSIIPSLSIVSQITPGLCLSHSRMQFWQQTRQDDTCQMAMMLCDWSAIILATG